jgi:glycosyltransferase involved in cell wall biosynthesis
MSTGEIRQVEIAVCTWNRQSLLAQTLTSFARLEIPDKIQLGFLIVDNNSTDKTAQVIREFQSSEFGQKHDVLALHEAKQGHTFSRNCAVESASGDLLLWTDDDVVVSADWVARYVNAANRSPDHAFWGSVIEPKFEADMPKWIEQNWEILKGCFAHRDLGDHAVEFSESRMPYGANFAIRTTVQKECPFDCDLGRRGEEVVGEDELDLMRRLLAQGYRGAWVPGAVVQHCIPPDRASEKFVYDYFVGQGRALVAKGEPWHSNVKRLKRESTLEQLKYRTKRRISPSPVWVGHLIRSALAQGQFDAISGGDTSSQ